MFYGRGAGADPTASAVANDILSILKDGAASFAPEFVSAKADDVIPSGKFACRRYVRTGLCEEQLNEVLGGEFAGVTEIENGAFITDFAFSEVQFDEILKKLGNVSTLRVL